MGLRPLDERGHKDVTEGSWSHPMGEEEPQACKYLAGLLGFFIFLLFLNFFIFLGLSQTRLPEQQNVFS